MAVPAHDDRDFAFATKYNLPIERVIIGFKSETEDSEDLPYTEHGIMVNSEDLMVYLLKKEKKNS